MELGLYGHTATPSFYVGSERKLRSLMHACAPDALSTEPFSTLSPSQVLLAGKAFELIQKASYINSKNQDNRDVTWTLPREASRSTCNIGDRSCQDTCTDFPCISLYNHNSQPKA